MRRNPTKSRIRPKISTMPRQQSEAAAFLDIYKLVIEKKRLEQELQSMDQRRQQILDRLVVLNSQVSNLEHTVHQIRGAEPPQPGASGVSDRSGGIINDNHDDDHLEMLFLEY